MSVIRVNKTKNYTVLSNHHFKEKAMSLKSKGLLSLMLSLPDDWNYSVSGLVSLSKDGKDSVMSALAELEEFGYLLRNRTTNDKGQFSGIEYNIYEEPQPKKPFAVKQNSVNQNADNANAEKPPLLKTKFIKNLNNEVLNELNTDIREINIDIYKSVLETIEDTSLRNLYVDYIEMRRNTGSPISVRGLEMLITRCERISGLHIEKQKRLLEMAIINNWKNVYHPKEDEVKEETLRNLRNFYFDE